MRDDNDNGVPDWVEETVEERTRREPSKVLTVAGDRALHGPTDLGLFAWRLASCGITGGMVLLELFLRWVTDAQRREELQRSEKHAAANGGKLPDTFRERSRDVARGRARTAAAVAGVALVGVGAACVREYVWGWQEWCVALAMLPLLWVAKEYKAPVLGKASVGLPIVAAVMGVESWRWWPSAIAGLVVLAACVLVGHQAVPPTPKRTADAPSQKWDYDLVWNSVELEALRHGKGVVLDRKGARPLSAEGREVGVAFTLKTSEPIVRELLSRFEFRLTMPEGGAVWVPNPDAAGTGELRLSFENGLPSFTTPRREPMSLDYTKPIPGIIRREGGKSTEISLNRTRVIMVGDSGSGKSESEADFIDAACDMPNADWYGIDVTEGPTFMPYKHQWNCRGLAFNIPDGIAMLNDLRAECKRRNRSLGDGQDEDPDAIVEPTFPVTDRDGERGIIVFIDELSSFTADSDAAEALILLIEVIRKASGSIVMATPDLDANRVPSAVMDQSNYRMGFSCPFTDAQRLFGKGSTRNGWNAWELVPAAGDIVNDATVAYVRGGVYNLPERHRFGFMSAEEKMERNRARRLWRERMGGGSTSSPDPDGVVDAEVVMSEHDLDVDALRAALEACGDEPGLRTSKAGEVLGADVLTRVRSRVKSAPTYFASTGESPRAFKRQALVDALTALLTGSDDDGGDGGTVSLRKGE